jgi:hypothetical protein
MHYRRAFVAGVVAVGLLAAALPAAAQDANEPISWLINVTVKPGHFMDLKNSTEKYDKPVLDKLMADGTIGSWGFACQVIGPPGEPCMYYVTAANWSAMSKVNKAFEDNRKAMKASEMKAMMESFLGATEPEKEASSVVRHVVFQAHKGGEVNYLMRHIYKVKPGKGSEVVKLYKAYIEPTYQKLLDAGVISGYGLAVPEIHTGAGWTHTSWIVFSDMSQLDAVDKAFEEAEKARSKELNEMLEATFMHASEANAHVDSLMHISMHGGETSK